MGRRYYRDELSILEGARAPMTFNEATSEWGYADFQGRTAEQILADYQEKASRLNAISGVYQRADRIITGEEIVVEVSRDQSMKEPASNSGKTITLNPNLIDTLDTDNIVALHGVNYHEVAHVLFSPRAGSNLAQYVRDNGLKRAFFILEEARAENLLVTKYPVTRLFLEATIMKYLLNDPESIGGFFPLITGRTYLPLEIRQAVVDKALQQFDKDMLIDFHKIIHEYRTLVFPRDFDKAKELSRRLAQYVGLDTEEPQKEEWNLDGHEFLKEGRPANTKEQETLQGRSKSKNNGVEDIAGRVIEPHSSKGVGGDSNQPTLDEDKEYTEEDKAIADMLNKRMEEIKSDRFVEREVSDTRKAILGSDEVRVSMRATTYATVMPNPVSQSIARKFGQELERIVLEQDPAWDTERPYGKLIPKRTMSPDINNIGRVFDRWDIGNDNTEIESIIMVDNSGSMGSLMRSVCENAWIMKRGIEAIRGNVTVYSFESESRKLYDSNERAKPNEVRYVHAQGSTNPIRAFIEAERILTASKRPIKLLFIVTDGEWYMTNECNAIISNLNDLGVMTCLVYLDEYKRVEAIMKQMKEAGEDEVSMKNWLDSIRHGAKLFKAVAKPRDILDLATSLVKELVGHERVA